MTTTNIIALCGLKRSGKDTVAQYIQEHYGYEHMSLSLKLKQALKLLFDFTDEQLESDNKDVIDPRWNTSPRKLMQFFGTDVMQFQLPSIIPGLGRHFFVNSLLSTLNTLPYSPQRSIVISDMRFLHEYEVLHKHGSLIVVEVLRNSCSADSHISENEFKEIPVDFTIENNGSLSELYQKVDDMMK